MQYTITTPRETRQLQRTDGRHPSGAWAEMDLKLVSIYVSIYNQFVYYTTRILATVYIQTMFSFGLTPSEQRALASYASVLTLTTRLRKDIVEDEGGGAEGREDDEWWEPRRSGSWSFLGLELGIFDSFFASFFLGRLRFGFQDALLAHKLLLLLVLPVLLVLFHIHLLHHAPRRALVTHLVLYLLRDGFGRHSCVLHGKHALARALIEVVECLVRSA